MKNCTTSVVITAVTRTKYTNYFSMLYVIHPVSYFIPQNYLTYKEKSSPIFQMSQTGEVVLLQSHCLNHYTMLPPEIKAKKGPVHSTHCHLGQALNEALKSNPHYPVFA